jgi:hypothetical protein
LIYFAQSPQGGTIKIGTSEDVPTRIKALEAHYGQPLAVLATMPGGREEEAAIHERFVEHRLGRTEQFRPVAEILAFIGRPLLVSPDPDAVLAMEGADSTGSIRIRMKGPFKAWTEGLAAHERITVAALIERALVDVARRTDYSPPPPER